MKIIPVTYISDTLMLYNKVVLITGGCTAVDEKRHDDFEVGRVWKMPWLILQNKIGRIPSMNMV